MASFSGGILDIPGLMPVNIGSSNPYPVPSWGPAVVPQMPTNTTPMQGGAAGQSGQYSQPMEPQTNVPGSVSEPGLPNISGFGAGGGGGGIDGTSQLFGGGYGDAQFATMGMNGFTPGYDYGSGQGTSFGGEGINDYGQGVFDRISSLTNSPTIRNDNLTQAGINALGLVSPLAGPLAGILQGFNLIDGGLPTGNAAADVAFTPSASQSLTADIANWINRQFGGEYMPYDLGQNTVNNSAGIQQVLGSLSNPYDPMANFAGFTEETAPDGSDHNSGAAADFTSQPLYDPYSMTGNMWTDFMQGATFGGGRFDPIGGGGGLGGMDTVMQPGGNGFWGS